MTFDGPRRIRKLLATFRQHGGGGCGGGGRRRSFGVAGNLDLARESGHLLDEEAWREVAEEQVLGLGIVVAALDEDGGQLPGHDLGRRLAPELPVARAEADAVGLDVAEDEYLATRGEVADEVRAAVVHADALQRAGRAVGYVCNAGAARVLLRLRLLQ